MIVECLPHEFPQFIEAIRVLVNKTLLVQQLHNLQKVFIMQRLLNILRFIMNMAILQILSMKYLTP